MLKASQLVTNAEQAAEIVAQDTAQIKASAEALFAHIQRETQDNVRTANAHVDGETTAASRLQRIAIDWI